MRVVSLHRDVLLLTSRVWATTCTVVRAPDGGESFVIDSPVFPDELEILPQVLDQAHFPVSGLLVTHGDWDHLLGRLAFPEAPLGCAESTAARLAAEPGAAARALREFDDEHYLERPAPLSLGAVQALPVPGRCEIGAVELELHPTAGHTADGMAIVIPWARIVVVGDYLSPVEIPTLSGPSVTEYLATLERLRALVTAAEYVVPGHGGPLGPQAALDILEADADYLRALAEFGERAVLPRAERSPTQRARHAENVSAVSRVGR